MADNPRTFFDIEIDRKPGSPCFVTNLSSILSGEDYFGTVCGRCPKDRWKFSIVMYRYDTLHVLIFSLQVGEKGLGRVTGKPLHYKGCPFHRIIKGGHLTQQICDW